MEYFDIFNKLKENGLDISIKNSKNESVEEIYKRMKENSDENTVENEYKNECKSEITLESLIPELYLKSDKFLPFFKKNDNYKQIKLISSDLVGSIYKCKWYGHYTKSHQMVILNINTDNCKSIYEMLNDWTKERVILHPGIIDRYGIIFEMNSNPIILEEYIECNLHDLIISKKKIEYYYILEIIEKIINTFLFLNSFEKPIICGSIVPTSIYVNEELDSVKIDDIGMYKIYEKITGDKYNSLYLRSGSFEIGERNINDDLYSLGICVIEMNVGDIINGDTKTGIKHLKNAELKPLIEKCLNVYF